MIVTGVKEVQAALDGLTGRKRQSVEKKAARATMNILKRYVKNAWLNASVHDPTRPKSQSIRKAAAKAVTVKVGTKGIGGRVGPYVPGSPAGHTHHAVYARLFHNYHKVNAGRAKLAHLLEWPHKTGGPKRGGVDTAKRARKMVQHSEVAFPSGFADGKYIVTTIFDKHHSASRDRYMRAIMLWIHRPKTTQKQARGIL